MLKLNLILLLMLNIYLNFLLFLQSCPMQYFQNKIGYSKFSIVIIINLSLQGLKIFYDEMIFSINESCIYNHLVKILFLELKLIFPLFK